jgi:hypothetical protein
LLMAAPQRHESSRAQEAAEHRDQLQQAKLAEIPIVKPQEPGPEDCCQVGWIYPHTRVGRACIDSLTTPLLLLMQRGCQECVWDVYWRDMKAYNEQVALAEGRSPPLDPFEVYQRVGIGSHVATRGCQYGPQVTPPMHNIF